MRKTLYNLRLTLLLALAAPVCSVLPATACTSVIVSGRITKDGRPFIFKNRDTPNQNNAVVQRQGERYRYLAVSGDNDRDVRNVWQGHNEAGFAILNTAAYNLNGREHTEEVADGQIMRRALEICATLKDFETLLDTLPHPLPANSNFGVMDAQGGVAYYETGNRGYTKFDANDPSVAPYGYLVRTNHALSGERDLDQGIERYMAISDLMLQWGFADHIDALTVLTQATRHLRHGLTRIDLNELQPDAAEPARLFPFRDFIPRYLSASASVIQGVKPGEPARHTVSWTIIGNPLTTVALPLLISPSGRLPQVVTRDAEGHSPLCQWGLRLRATLFPMKRGNHQDYIDLARLVNRQGTGILQRLRPLEQELLQKAAPVVEAIREKDDWRGLDTYYRWADEHITDAYENL